MGLFQNKNMQNISYRASLETQYRTARMNLLLVVIFTAVNLVFLLAGGSAYFLFSASIPYYLVSQGLISCGMLSEDFYAKYAWEGEFYPNSYLAIMIVIAVAILAVYVLCWIFSKKKPAWLIASLALFGIDTLGMFYIYGFSISMIVDIIFHIWVLLYLIIGVAAYSKLKKLPEDETDNEPQNNGFSDVYNSTFGQPSNNTEQANTNVDDFQNTNNNNSDDKLN